MKHLCGQTDGAVKVSQEPVALEIELCKLSMEKLMSFPLFILISQDAPDFFEEPLPCGCLEDGVTFRMNNKCCKTLCALSL